MFKTKKIVEKYKQFLIRSLININKVFKFYIFKYFYISIKRDVPKSQPKNKSATNSYLQYTPR